MATGSPVWWFDVGDTSDEECHPSAVAAIGAGSRERYQAVTVADVLLPQHKDLGNEEGLKVLRAPAKH